MRWLANRIMSRRAERIFNSIRRHLPADGTIADIGSGSGHNAERIRTWTSLNVQEYDVADIHWTGPGPRLIEERIPAPDGCFQASLLLYVLQYPQDAVTLLQDVARITAGPIVLLQSTCQGRVSRLALGVREFFFGRFGYFLAHSAGLVLAASCPLMPLRYYTYSSLLADLTAAGLSVVEESKTGWFGIRRYLLVLRRTRTDS